MPKSNDGDQPTRQRIERITRNCVLCGTKIEDMARRTMCKTCWRDAIKTIYGDIRAQELANQGMYERIDD